jgi:hypothetical protein
MPTFAIAWTSTGTVTATLWEQTLIEGRPASRRICKLGDLGEAEQFWRDARARLGRMHRLTGRDRDEIERLLAIKVPRPAPTEKPPSVRAPR